MEEIHNQITFVIDNSKAILTLLRPLFGLDDNVEYVIENHFMDGDKQGDPSYFFIHSYSDHKNQCVGCFSLYVEYSSKDWMLTITDAQLKIFQNFENPVNYKIIASLTNEFSVIDWKLRAFDMRLETDNFILIKSQFDIKISTYFNRGLDDNCKGELNYTLTENTSLISFLEDFDKLVILFCTHTDIFKIYDLQDIIDSLNNEDIIKNMKTVVSMTYI